ncbi:MAG: hypothetical protein HZA54_19415 [Planctomycetes bacterium]|nr:hypothetical protein [Planctomycetota bacterium]
MMVETTPPPPPAGVRTRRLWAGIALVAGLGMIDRIPPFSGDALPAALFLCLVVGLALRLRTGPVLFLGVWCATELRYHLPALQALGRDAVWAVPAGGLEPFADRELLALALLYLLASCQHQFLSSGTDLKQRTAFEITLPGGRPEAEATGMLVGLVVRTALVALLLAGLHEAASRLAYAPAAWNFPPMLTRAAGVFCAAGLGFLVGSRLFALARFLSLDRTSAACFLDDQLWQVHRGLWQVVARRAAKRI